MGIKYNFVFMEDYDPKHTAHNTKMWILHNTPEYLKTSPQSPDINPIEHLWDHLERKIRIITFHPRKI
jgi:transposase